MSGEREDGSAETPDAKIARLQAALAEAESLYRTLADQLPVTIYRKDRQGRFLYGNRRFCETLERPLEQILGRTDYDFSAPELADKYVADDQPVLAGEAFQGVEQHLDREGLPTYIQIYKFPIRNSAGAVVGTQGVWFDVTPIKRAETALSKRSAELEAALEALETNQEQLVVSEKMASLGRLTAGIAHEMNTPLAAARSALADLERLVDEYADSAGDLEVSADDHREIAGEMRARLRLSKGALEKAVGFVRGIKSQTRGMALEERRRFDLVAVVREALLLLGHAIRHRKIALDFRAAAPTLEIEGDPGRLAQVVTNLVTNAIDASPAAGGPLRVAIDPDADDRVAIEVADAGCGIPPENLNRIFDPMFTTKPFGEGTGLGLTIVHDIVTGALGGTIDVQSEVGRGTTFTIRLPRAPSQRGT
jgi:PAS domain S-box-containing protein